MRVNELSYTGHCCILLYFLFSILIVQFFVAQDIYSTITKRINNKPVEVRGYFGDIWDLLANQLNFR